MAIGDRIVAADSSLSDKLWPVSTVEGVISALTVGFERPNKTAKAAASLHPLRAETTSTAVPSSLAAAAVAQDAAVSPDAAASPTQTKGNVIVNPTAPSQKELIRRCRDVLKRYAIKDTENSGSSSSSSTAVVLQMSALAANKVVDALASAAATIDSVTLSMIKHTYLLN